MGRGSCANSGTDAMSEKVVIDGSAPDWAAAMARQVEKALAAQAKRIRELEARIKALETP